MKFVNPGVCHLMNYQTIDRGCEGQETELTHSHTGFYMNVSCNDKDVYYKNVTDTKYFCLLFD